MKNHLLIILIITSLALPAIGQDSVTVAQIDRLMSKGTHTGFEMEIPQARLKDVISAWKKYIRRGETKNSVEFEDDEYQLTGTTLANITSSPLNVYSKIRETAKGVQLTAFFTPDDSSFISTSVNAIQAEGVQKMIHDFGIMQYRLAVEHELNSETRKREQYEKELEMLIADKESYHKNIGELERKIDRTKKEIETNAEEQSKRRAEVANQKEIVRVTTPKTETYDLEEKKYNSLEKELKKLERSGEKMHGDIDGWNADIRTQQRNIEKNEDMQKEKKETVSKQKDNIKSVQRKLEDIR